MIDITKEREYLKSLEGFTPGPWRWNKYGSVLQSSMGRDTVDFHDPWILCHSVCYQPGGKKGNAGLIAAAPDLYRKYGEALDELEKMQIVADLTDPVIQKHKEVLKEIELRRNQNTVGDAQTRIALDENERLREKIDGLLETIRGLTNDEEAP